MNFTGATWANTMFSNSEFRVTGGGDPKIVFRQTSFTDVLFSNVVFDMSAQIYFREFEFNNVTFENCFFHGKLIMVDGSMSNVKFVNTTFAPKEGVLPKKEREIIFTRVTVREAVFVDSYFASTFRVYGARLADVNFNRTDMNEFSCLSSRADNPEPSVWNDTVFDDLDFNGNVNCKGTTWRGLFMRKIVFWKKFDFARTDILDMAWDRITHKTVENDKICHTFNLSESRIRRKYLHNLRGLCDVQMENANFETISIKNVSSKTANLKGATFSNQEYVAGQCCTKVCEKRGCLCNVTKLSGRCPKGSSKVLARSSDSSCFPADARLTLENGGLVRMDEVLAGHRVAIDHESHSDVFFFGHKKPEAVSEFVRMDTAHSQKTGASPLRISPGHYLYVNGGLATARSVKVGDNVKLADGSSTPILAIRTEMRQGVFAPTTLHGDLVVDGILVSSYTDAIHPRLAHVLLHPLRLVYRAGLNKISSRFTMFHEQEWSALPRFLRIPRGPALIE